MAQGVCAGAIMGNLSGGRRARCPAVAPARQAFHAAIPPPPPRLRPLPRGTPPAQQQPHEPLPAWRLRSPAARHEVTRGRAVLRFGGMLARCTDGQARGLRGLGARGQGRRDFRSATDRPRRRLAGESAKLVDEVYWHESLAAAVKSTSSQRVNGPVSVS